MFKQLLQQGDTWSQTITPWLLSSGLRILFIIVVSFIIYFISKKIIVKAIRVLVVNHDIHDVDGKGELQRENTLIQIFTITLKVSLAIIASLMIASEFGLQIGPILASAGVIGLALGFGGQYLIKDLISGLFIIMENQYRINDYIQAADKSGQVERITLRMTTLRDLDGNIHYLPHGEIKTVTNFSKQFSRININIGVGYGSDIDKVAALVNKVGAELAADTQWKKAILSAPQFLRVDELGDSAVIIKIIGDTQPSEQWSVAGEMRKRLYMAFNENNIEIPFPQRVVHIMDAK